MEPVAPIYITVPIVINTHSSLPLTLSIGGQNVPLNAGLQAPAYVKQHSEDSVVKPTSVFNKIMDYTAVTRRPTNRHRSNFRKKIYARHNNHEVEAFEY